MQNTLTVGERIVLHLAQYSKFIDSYDAPIEISQDGIAAALRISRAHAAIELKKLRDSSEVTERLCHIKRGKTKRKVYFLTPLGEDRGAKVRQFAEKEGIDIEPFLDLRKCKGPDLWGSLDDFTRPIFAQACVFRRPFHRSAIPETSVSLLPEDEIGMTLLPIEVRSSIVPLMPAALQKQCHSFAADYWLNEGNYRERLFHLISAGRTKEAEMLLATKGGNLIASADEDLFSIVCSMPDPSPRYRFRVMSAQAEIARKAKRYDHALMIAKRMRSSEDVQESIGGLIVEGLVLRDRGEHQGSCAILMQARSMSSASYASLDCEIADSLILASRYPEARTVLEGLMISGIKDGDMLERVFYLLGTIALKTGDASDAVKLFSKSRGAAKDKENGEVLASLSDAYSLLGMKEKATEYALRAKRIKGPGPS